MKNLIVCTLNLIQSGLLNLEDQYGQRMQLEQKKLGFFKILAGRPTGKRPVKAWSQMEKKSIRLDLKYVNAVWNFRVNQPCNERVSYVRGYI